MAAVWALRDENPSVGEYHRMVCGTKRRRNAGRSHRGTDQRRKEKTGASEFVSRSQLLPEESVRKP